MEGEGAVALSAEVLVSADLSEDSRQHLAEDLRRLGVEPTIRQVLRRRGISDIPPWLVLVALPLQPFFTTLLEKLAGDAYSRLKALVVGLFRRHSEAAGSARVLILQDTRSGVRIVLEPDLPAESYQQLQHLDLSTAEPGQLRYDRSMREWRCTLDAVVRPDRRSS